MCDYPDCSDCGIYLEYMGSIQMWLCDKHKKLADFIRKVMLMTPEPH